MIEVLRQQYTAEMSLEEKTNRIREFLQILALKILSDKGYFENLAFVGGPALRMLYNLRRFSEDLDFSLVNKKRYRFTALLSSLRQELASFGFQPELKIKEEKTVQAAFIKFPDLLYEIGISAHKQQKLSIRIEVDTNPPSGAITETSLINKFYLFSILRFDLPSLYATKLHACFFRRYTKGRDFYDLVWYLGKNIEPNYTLLNNAIKQTHGKTITLTKANLNTFIVEQLGRVDFKTIRKDVERFLEDKTELKLLDFRVLKELLKA